MTNTICEWFSSFTTIGGLGQTLTSAEKYWKFAWATLTCVALYFTFIGAKQTIDEFLAYNVTTSFSISHKPHIELPSVTICNINRVHCGNLLKKIFEYDQHNEVKVERLCKLYKLTGCDVAVQIAEKTIIGEVESNYSICDDKYNYEDIKELHKSMKEDEIDQAFMEIYLTLNHTELSDLAHHPIKTIKKCTMGLTKVTDQCKRTMSNEDAKRVIIPRYGVCYLHNFERLDSSITPEQTGSSGPDYGLNFIFDIQSEFYMRYGLSPTTGLQLTLNDPNAMPVVLSKPILLSPNIKTAIKVLKQVVTRQPAPYVTQCSDQYPDTYLQNPILSSLIDFSSVRYTEDYCKSTCRVQYVNETCECLDPLLLEASFLEKVNTTNLQFCSVVQNSTSRNCSTYALEEYAKNKGENCPCKPSCYVENYEHSISEIKWPSDQYWAVLAERYETKYQGKEVTYEAVTNYQLHGNDSSAGAIDEVESMVNNNLLQVTIYYGSMDVSEVAEDPEFTTWTFLSSLGGSVSLFLGISFIQCFELVELLLKFLGSALSRKRMIQPQT